MTFAGILSQLTKKLTVENRMNHFCGLNKKKSGADILAKSTCGFNQILIKEQRNE